ncbi:rhomboid family intramembrane serine protease [Rhodococcus sp. BP-252]|uniref:Rhomboid family intramembrane serine protease n=1 Tax=Rhodococcoides kyotonense TaxID=398843 RepID=A0A177YMR5_9NOCA|nr:MULTISPECIES: rhomboid family intramembrane serine protease [Rhodococcus]MBY6412909.1 rhomboid family intramembrane serine protease [Rhodococcus sp. BP-320]MBY6417554.1 rhomboid family intramembrane serine protease [Rhodococcus sp. BP-321]MBY6423074.1 rhomboid family intramembrane serine protease [Rhodococcus sp. BP-324]MBY6427578.1 rhomboid family intramembrane serine protease [Rhodococcus sp. BP-323]MBY6432742.1 rhomboid family intramembrane serine protease [Rhodococcus sp. BP-322]
MTANPYLPAPTPKRPVWQQAAMVVGGFVVLLWIIELIDVASGSRVEDAGINPRTVDGLWGILFAPVLHDDWTHLIANTVPVLVLGFLVLLSGIGRGLTATGIIWVLGGVGTWLTAGAGTNHIGASILIFGWITYLLTRGIFARNLGQLAIGVVVFVIYGGALWGVLPTDAFVSWQGHLFGAVGGVVAAWTLSADARQARRQNSLS